MLRTLRRSTLNATRAAGLAALAMGAVPAGAAKADGLSPAQRVLSVSSSNAPGGAGEVRFRGYLTGYGYWDNTPPGSAEISKPVIHRKAGGKGTWRDPVTIAVGHVIEGGRQTLDFAPGTRFYIPRLQKYAIVEDVCGDGHRPQDGPCHTGHKGHVWLDIYIGGAGVTARDTEACARRLTGLQDIVLNPRRDYPVVAGDIATTGCRVF